MSRGWIGVDLDGTLAHYDHWNGIDHIGAPIPLMVERVKTWLAEGKTVKIFTARVAAEGLEKGFAIAAIQDWCQEHLGQVLEITNVKDFAMIECWDDRAVQVVPNTGRPVSSVWEAMRG